MVAFAFWVAGLLFDVFVLCVSWSLWSLSGVCSDPRYADWNKWSYSGDHPASEGKGEASGSYVWMPAGKANGAPLLPGSDEDDTGDVSDLSEAESETPVWLRKGLTDRQVIKRKRKLDLNEDLISGGKKLKAANALTEGAAVPAPTAPAASGSAGAAGAAVPKEPADKRTDVRKKKKSKDSKKKKSHKKKGKKHRKRSSSSRSSSGSSSSSSTLSAAGVFREATATRSRSSQDELIDYARRHPGRLACATLQTWDRLSARTGETPKVSKTAMPACARRFFLNVVKPSVAGATNNRNVREIEVLAHVQDMLSTNRIAEACDVITQRMQACRLAEEEKSWLDAHYLELIPLDSLNMVSKAMRQLVKKEGDAERRQKKSAGSNDDWWTSGDWGKSKGKGKWDKSWGKGKGGKDWDGKNKNKNRPWNDWGKGDGKNKDWRQPKKY